MSIPLPSRPAIVAAQLSHTLLLPTVDSIILATARSHQARLYTMNEDRGNQGATPKLAADPCNCVL
jgi:hypothetical protein